MCVCVCNRNELSNKMIFDFFNYCTSSGHVTILGIIHKLFALYSHNASVHMNIARRQYYTRTKKKYTFRSFSTRVHYTRSIQKGSRWLCVRRQVPPPLFKHFPDSHRSTKAPPRERRGQQPSAVIVVVVAVFSSQLKNVRKKYNMHAHSIASTRHMYLCSIINAE